MDGRRLLDETLDGAGEQGPVNRTSRDDPGLDHLTAVGAAPGPEPELSPAILHIDEVIHDHQAMTSLTPHLPTSSSLEKLTIAQRIDD
jgi:hypothetical protein